MESESIQIIMKICEFCRYLARSRLNTNCDFHLIIQINKTWLFLIRRDDI